MRRFLAVVLAFAVVAAGVPVASGAGAPTGADTAASVSGATAPATQGAVAPADNESDNETTVTLLTYNDVQTAMAQNTTVPRMIHLVNERRAAHDNPTVVVGGGDQVSPHSLAPVSQWRLPVEVLNVLQPDVEVVGNHDLDYGFGPVANYSNESEFPWVMANIVQTDSGEPIPGTEPYTVVERDGVRVGVIGLADEQILGKTAVDFDEQGYELRDYAEVGQEYATQLREEENVDVVVVAGHFGVPTAQDLANRTAGIDAVVVGDDEVEYPPQETNGTVVVEAEARAEHVGEVNLTVSDGEVTSWNGRLLSVTENTTKNQTADRIITETRGEALSQVVGETRTELDARFASNYHDETALGNLITDAFRWKEGSEIAITNAGGIRSNSVYGPGEVTVGDVYNMLPFGNTLVTVELTGDEVTQLLESQVVTMESETGQQYGAEPQLQVSGITYEYVPHEDVPADQRIQDVWVNGEPLDAEETYTVTVNSYMAGWEGSVLENATRVSETQDLYGTVTVEYIQAHSPVSPTDEDRIRRVNHLAGQDPVTLDGEGTVTAEFALPENATDVRHFYATTNASTMVESQTVRVGEDTVTVNFSDYELRRLASEDAEIQVYATYNSSSLDTVYFDRLRLAGDLEVTLESPETATPTATPSAAPTTAADTTAAGTTGVAPATTEESDDGGSPGFGPGVALVALVAAALVALRRR
jgi:PGF-CTERM protein